jgi:hypothetical protein
MNLISYQIVSDPTFANLAAALTSKATGLAAQGRVALPVKVRDDLFFGELEPGLLAVVIVEDKPSNLLGYLDAVLGTSDAVVAPAIVAQITALQS